MSNIRLVNKKNHKATPFDVYIGRGSPLGNPYDFRNSQHPAVKFHVKNRDEAISNYKKYLNKEIKDCNPVICDALNNLFIKNFRNEEIVLVCFCYPECCHGDYIYHLIKSAKYCINWFSNMKPFDEPMIYQGIEYKTPENFYQSMKAGKEDLVLREEIASMTPFESKQVAKKIKIREDWEDIKLSVMEYALRYKFARNTSWGEKLLDFPEKTPIIEYNNWGDTFWGQCIFSGEGQNNLGKILMNIKRDLKNGK